jgi:hypothetical protein
VLPAAGRVHRLAGGAGRGAAAGFPEAGDVREGPQVHLVFERGIP